MPEICRFQKKLKEKEAFRNKGKDVNSASKTNSGVFLSEARTDLRAGGVP